MQNRTKIRHLRLLRHFNDLFTFWVSFLTTFGSILASKSRSKIDHNFGMLFCRIPGRGAASTDRRRAVGAPEAQVPVPRIPPRRRPFSRAEGSYKRLGSQAPRPKASLTRSNTPWARGPANFRRPSLKRRILPKGAFPRGIENFDSLET